MKKKFLCLVIVFMLVFNNMLFNDIALGATINKQDISTHWAVQYMDKLKQRLNVVKEVDSNSNVNAADIEMLENNILKIEKLDVQISCDDWNKLVCVVFDIRDNNVNNQGEYLTRQEALFNIMNILKEKFNLSISDSVNSKIKNEPDYEEKLKDDNFLHTLLAYSEGIITGYDDSTFQPEKYITNAGAITIIERICSIYGLPEVLWKSDINLIKNGDCMELYCPNGIEDIFWTNDNAILFLYNNDKSQMLEAAKVFIDENKSVKALEYDGYNVSENLINESAFLRETGYSSSNKIVLNKKRRYINKDGKMKYVDIPYNNYYISEDNTKALIQKDDNVNIFDFLTEKSILLKEYYLWADKKYDRNIKWSPNSRYIISTLLNPDDEIGIEQKNKFAIFDCDTGKIVKIINDYGYYSFYPVWSPDSSKIAYFRVKNDDKQIGNFINNRIDNSFNLLCKEIVVYDLNTDKLTCYSKDNLIFLAEHQDGIMWSPKGDKLYLKTVADNQPLLESIKNHDEHLNIDVITNEIWELSIKDDKFIKIIQNIKEDDNSQNKFEDNLNTPEQIIEDLQIDNEKVEEDKNIINYDQKIINKIDNNEYSSNEENIKEDNEVIKESEIAVEKNNEGEYPEYIDMYWDYINNMAEDEYSTVLNMHSISKNGKRIIYSKKKHNLTRYENTVSEFWVRDLVTGEEVNINELVLTDYWWMDDGSLIVVENDFTRSRYLKMTYIIKKINLDYSIDEIVRFEQFPTIISMSPNRDYIMMHQYRAEKDVKIIKLY